MLLLEEIVAPIHLNELRSMPDILPALLSTLRTDVSQTIEAIRASVEAGDVEALSRATHGIAGAAGSVGGFRLAAVCRQLEQLARGTRSVDGAKSLLPLIETEYSNLCYALELITQEPPNTP